MTASKLIAEKRERVASLLQQIAELHQQVRVLQEQIMLAESRCHHDWEQVEEVEEYLHPTLIPWTGSGMDPEPTYRYEKRTRPRWKRTCSRCGMVQTTIRQKPSAELVPDFS